MSYPPMQQGMGQEEQQGASKNRALAPLEEAGLICTQYQYEGYRSVSDFIYGDPGAFTTNQVLSAISCGGCWGYLCHFFEVENGNVRGVTMGNGDNHFYGLGSHCMYGPGTKVDASESSVAGVEGTLITNGQQGMITITQGTIGLFSRSGEPLVLPPGFHYWNDPNTSFKKIIPMEGDEAVTRLGPYTLVRVDRGLAAITSDNGAQRVLEGGRTYLLNHRNWQFKAWLSQKLQIQQIGPFQMVTGDNISLDVTAIINFIVRDPHLAAARNVDVMNAAKDNVNVLAEIFTDVKTQVTASLSNLVGRLKYAVRKDDEEEEARRKAAEAGEEGGKEEESPPEEVNELLTLDELIEEMTQEKYDRAIYSMQQMGYAKRRIQGCLLAARGEKALTRQFLQYGPPEELIPKIRERMAETKFQDTDVKLDRKCLWSPKYLRKVLEDVNFYTSRYGVEVSTVVLKTADARDKRLQEMLQKGSLAAVRAEELAKQAHADAAAELTRATAEQKQARAIAETQRIEAESKEKTLTTAARGNLQRAQTEAAALLAQATAEAERVTIKAESIAEAEKIKANGAKLAGEFLAQSQVATELEKLRMAYSTMTDNEDVKTYFFGMSPSDLPASVMGEDMAKTLGLTDLLKN